MNRQQIASVIQRVFDRQSDALAELCAREDSTIVDVAQMLLNNQGRLVLTGIGKMGAIARKAASTFSSTGTPAIFVHPSEALHGDLGMITNDDNLIALSYSGETGEVLQVVETVQPWKVPVIALTRSVNSSLGRLADCCVQIEVPAEGTDLVAVPSCSTTIAMVLCDALAIAVMENRGFTADDFSIFHPGGALGRNLRTRVRDLMHTGGELPIVKSSQTLREAIVEVSRKGIGATLVVDQTEKLLGIITDGDIRRMLQQHENPLEIAVEELMTIGPKVVQSDMLAAKALRILEEFRISVLPVTDKCQQLVGIVHLHDIVSAGIG